MTTKITSTRDRIDRIKNGVPIEKLIGARFTMKGSGKQLSTVEHSSLTIYTASNSFYWFKEGYGGDHFDWLKNQYGMPFGEALDYLEKMYVGLPVDVLTEVKQRMIFVDEPIDSTPLPKSLPDKYHDNLKGSHTLIEKILEERGFDEDVVDRYNIGFCNNHWDKGPSWTIPITDDDGSLLTVRHRQWICSNQSPKYLPERKGDGNHLFNKAILDDKTMIVEGEFKAITCTERYMPTCAISGCQSFKDEWASFFVSKCKRAYIVLDGDVKVSNPFNEKENNPHGMSWIRTLVEHGCDCRLVQIEGKPDDLINIGGVRMLDRAVNNAKSIRIKLYG